MSVAVVVDSASDIPDELAESFQITRVPLIISIGDSDYKDGTELSRVDFWREMEKSSTLARTAAPAPAEFEQAFSRLLEGGADGVLCLTMTSDLSATYQAAASAASGLEGRVAVVDTRTLTLTEGLIALEVADRAVNGATLAECREWAESLLSRARTFGTLDTLENLRKGGRIGAASALLGTLMSFKPLIEVRGGVVEAAGRVRTRKTAISSLLGMIEGLGPVQRAGLVHAMAPDVDLVADQLRDATGLEEITVSVMGATIGTHAGPGALGVSLLLEDRH